MTDEEIDKIAMMDLFPENKLEECTILSSMSKYELNIYKRGFRKAVDILQNKKE